MYLVVRCTFRKGFFRKIKFTGNIFLSHSKQVMGDPSKTLMVRHFSRETTTNTLREMFERYGDIVRCRVVRDIVTGFSRGYGFVEFKHRSDCEAVLRSVVKRPVVLDGATLTVDRELERTLPGWVPRRFGGGFGGLKEGGQLRFGGIDRPFRRPITLGSVKLRRESAVSARDSKKPNQNQHAGSFGCNERRRDKFRDSPHNCGGGKRKWEEGGCK